MSYYLHTITWKNGLVWERKVPNTYNYIEAALIVGSDTPEIEKFSWRLIHEETSYDVGGKPIC